MKRAAWQAEMGHDSTWNKQNLFLLMPEWKRGAIIFIAFQEIVYQAFHALGLFRFTAEWTNHTTSICLNESTRRFFTSAVTLHNFVDGVEPSHFTEEKTRLMEVRELLRFSQLEG